MGARIVRLEALHYAHILDASYNTTELICGPATHCLKGNEELLLEPTAFVVVPRGHYCVVADPIVEKTRASPAEPYKLKIGHREVRLHQEPFPLYPGEQLALAVRKLPYIVAGHALRLCALQAFTDESSGEDPPTERAALDEWLLEGPRTYEPHSCVKVLSSVAPVVIRQGQAVRLRALQRMVDWRGVTRNTGEEWLVDRVGAYLPQVHEKLLDMVEEIVLTDEVALQMRATVNFDDRTCGCRRLVGEEWLVTSARARTYLPDVCEEVTARVNRTVLDAMQYCVVVNPYDPDTRRNLRGKRVLRRGVQSFFLYPGEQLERGVEPVMVLGEDEALLVEAVEGFRDGATDRPPGVRWLVRGPAEYVPPVEARVLSRRRAIPLDAREGVYVRDTATGLVRVEVGPQAFMLAEHEELYQKQLPRHVEKLLAQGGGCNTAEAGQDIRKLAYFEAFADQKYADPARDRSRLVSYRCPHNCAVQVNDYQRRVSRVVFGPELVVLGPGEDFNVLSASAGKPKRTNAMLSLVLMLGPDYITDTITVETSDHARLEVRYACNNLFDVDRADPAAAARLFSVPDFIGHACAVVASRIRAAVARTPFDQFHRHSAAVIRQAVFGVDPDGGGRSGSEQQQQQQLRFPENGMVLTGLDVQQITPVDTHMRDSLAKSVQLAIEISTSSIEEAAKQEAQRLEQISKGALTRQNLLNDMRCEAERVKLLSLQAESAAVESAGQATAEAAARCETHIIEGNAGIVTTRLAAEAKNIEFGATLSTERARRDAETDYKRRLDQLEIDKKRRMAQLESQKFASIVNAVGQDTIRHVAAAGPELQLKLLQGLGIRSVLITDGTSPINLFDTANGLVAQPVQQALLPAAHARGVSGAKQ